MKQTIFSKLKTKRQVYKTVPIGDVLGVRTMPDYEEELTFNVEVDMVVLSNMARRAAKNTHSRSVDGPITVTVAGRKRLT